MKGAVILLTEEIKPRYAGFTKTNLSQLFLVIEVDDDKHGLVELKPMQSSENNIYSFTKYCLIQ